MSAPLWLQFTGQQPKRKRAELACIACHSKKVPRQLWAEWTDDDVCRFDATSKREGVKDTIIVLNARLPGKTAGRRHLYQQAHERAITHTIFVERDLLGAAVHLALHHAH